MIAGRYSYEEWCHHTSEIYKRALDWTRDIEADPDYYPYNPSKRRKAASQLESQPQNNIVSFQQSLALDAEQRIKTAIATLQATDQFPTGATARADAIIAIARCSNQTLHKHKELWHPDHAASGVDTLTEPVTATSGDPAVLPYKTLEPLPEESLHDFVSNKFLANPAAPLEQAEKLQEVGGVGGFPQVKPQSLLLQPQNKLPLHHLEIATRLLSLRPRLITLFVQALYRV
jgi:hypothetical protein